MLRRSLLARPLGVMLFGLLAACAAGSAHVDTPDEPPVADAAGSGGRRGGAQADAADRRPPATVEESDARAPVGGRGGADSGPPDAGQMVDGPPPDARAPDADPAPGTPDAGGGGSGGTSPPPAGTVPMFVVSGHLGRTVTSCDDGRTWKASDWPGATQDAFNEKGIAFGHGVFMRVLGWGADCSFMRSEDGVTWQRISLSQAGLPNMSECGGIAYNGDGFTMVHWGGSTYASDHDGFKWKKIGMFSNREHVREVVGDGPAPGIILAGGANDPSGAVKNPPHVSVDGGKTWKPTPGCSNFNAISIGQVGGGALGGGRMVFVGFKGQVCTSTDMVAWKEAQIPGVAGSVQGKVSYDGAQFWLADHSRLMVSADGLTWTERKLPSTVRMHAVAKSGTTGTMVGFDRGTSAFYRSTDGVGWTPAVGPGDGPDLFRVVFGYGKPSARCPLR